ncbi:Patatin/Phospholipase A2-like protein [Ceratocystis lukuohia]|uniref:Patatin/Phospholipase A2-like protein n=1 Tax=Ceratocystis lukuohia TaxID=2019550 RepID=A0ABR4MH73_9PEZI
MSSHTSQPVKVLSLDGCVICGIPTLLILEKVMEGIKDAKGLSEVPKPCEIFDLIGGINTGGIIALMLGPLRMTVDQSIRAFRELVEVAFTPKRRSILPASPSSAFSAKKLEDAIKKVIREYCTMPSCMEHRQAGNSTTDFCQHENQELHDDSCTKTVVLAMAKSSFKTKPTLFTTYSHSTGLSGSKIWEVARATSAAAPFFKSIKVGRDETEFIDTRYTYNNPCKVLIEEATSEFPGRGMTILSIGAGLRDVIDIKVKQRLVREALKTMATTSEAVASRLRRRYRATGCYYRFNIENATQDITPSAQNQTSTTKAYIDNYLEENNDEVERFIKVISNSNNTPNSLAQKGGLAGSSTVHELGLEHSLVSQHARSYAELEG